MKEFPMDFQSGCAARSFWKFSAAAVPNQIRPREISTVLLVAAVIIQKSGNTLIKDQMVRKI